MRTLSIRANVWLLVAAALLLAATTGSYAALSLFPAVREAQRATAPLQEVGDRVDAAAAWAERTARVAEATLSRGGRGGADSLREWLGLYDLLEAAQPTVGVSDSVRVILSSAGSTVSRFAVTLEEMRAALELGRRDVAAQRLADARQIQQRLLVLAAHAQADGLAGVVAAQREVEAASRRLVAVFVLWVAGSAILLGWAVRFVRRRVAWPLRHLQDGLARLADGDLGVRVVPHAEDEIAALALQFNQMTDVMRSRAETQGQMAAASVLLGNVAHEVNNPLMSIGATAESILADGEVSPPVRHDLEEILRQARRAGKLVRGIERFVRPAPGADALVDVGAVAREALDLVAFQFTADGATCALALASDLPRVRMDGQQLEHVLVVLLANAHDALARSPGGPRRVTIRTWLEAGRVRAEVRDTGPGVAPEVRDRLFRPFAASRAGGHVGLGLYTARLLVREVGGDLAHEPPAEGGAAFVITLPAAEEAPRPAGPRVPAERRTLQGKRVLLVDDEPAVRAPLAKFLSRRGAVVREAGDGVEALGALDEGPYDIVVADLRMPGMGGAALFQALRGRDPGLADRMLFLSGDVAQLGDVGAEIDESRVMPKPVELAEFERFLLAHP